MQGCSREGEEKSDPELFSLIGVVFKSCLEIHSAPVQKETLNSYWSLEWEAVSDERSGCFDPCTLGYSSSGWGHWPLVDAGSLSGMLNCYWPSAHPGSLGRLNGALNFHWLSGDSFSSSFSLTFWDEARREELRMRR